MFDITLPAQAMLKRLLSGGDGEFKNAPLLKEWQRWIRGKQPGQANCPTYHSAENKVLLVGQQMLQGCRAEGIFMICQNTRGTRRGHQNWDAPVFSLQ